MKTGDGVELQKGQTVWSYCHGLDEPSKLIFLGMFEDREDIGVFEDRYLVTSKVRLYPKDVFVGLKRCIEDRIKKFEDRIEKCREFIKEEEL